MVKLDFNGNIVNISSKVEMAILVRVEVIWRELIWQIIENM